MKKIQLSIIMMMSLVSIGVSQSLINATIGSTSGQFRNGNVSLSFTIGETFVGNQSNGNTKLGNGFWSIVPASYVSSAIAVYTFTGDGNWNLATNWVNNQVPPDSLPSGAEIIINPSGTCILNVPQNISPGAGIRVIQGKKFVVNGDLRIRK